MTIRRFAGADLSAVCTIQALCPQTAQWREGDYLQLAGSLGGVILVAEADAGTPGAVTGFAAFHRVIDEAELRNLAVDPAHWRRGIGRQLLAEGIRVMRKAGARRIFLEVRASNHAARELYTSLGFTTSAIRKGYYRDPEEDAVVMSCDVHF
jgi:[ribosomal protein S18]-alanine N-acetyltransferase